MNVPRLCKSCARWGCSHKHVYRVMELRALGVDPFVMPYDKTDPYQRRFARWVNHKAIFKSVEWKDYGLVRGKV